MTLPQLQQNMEKEFDERFMAYGSLDEQVSSEDVKFFLNKQIELAYRTRLEEIDRIDWDNEHICPYNDGNSTCDCMVKTITTIINTLKK